MRGTAIRAVLAGPGAVCLGVVAPTMTAGSEPAQPRARATSRGVASRAPTQRGATTADSQRQLTTVFSLPTGHLSMVPRTAGPSS